jgi:four helix bundle protein
MAIRVEELQVWQRAREFGLAVNAIIEKPGLLRDRRLREQIVDAADSILSNISEGFEQPTDRSFVKYLYVQGLECRSEDTVAYCLHPALHKQRRIPHL